MEPLDETTRQLIAHEHIEQLARDFAAARRWSGRRRRLLLNLRVRLRVAFRRTPAARPARGLMD